ncbi:ankyrin repeat-containing protein At5g02620-like isoform X2 [Actinidia eriantha]|uniref:ankyrin repeat-containing protein At5g02620-like isoform X2 n=1 Tax=Actinidia eriantha TaxID=165200 RepID=UPI002583188E|nr:ankyrin repeat-containing protein At5g02620-like isoform X2 [Actinidia eriantha]
MEAQRQPNRERMEERLKNAALEGNTQELLEIHKGNPLLLDRVTVGSFDTTPLHVAALRGHTDFAERLVILNPDLAESLDSSGSSALHLASAKGYVPIVMALVSKKPNMCLARDREGMNPLHLAAKKGRVEVLKELVRIRPEAAEASVDQVGTVLHLCVKHFQLEALKVLMEAVTDEFIQAGDAYGNTILHLAVADKQTETVKYLLMSGKIEVNARNANGYAALDVLTQSLRDIQDWDIGNSLQEAGALKASAIPSSCNANRSESPRGMPAVVHYQTTRERNSPNHMVVQDGATQLPTNGSNQQIPSFLWAGSSPQKDAQGGPSKNNLNQGEWLAKDRDALMVVASLLASLTFQAGVNPPGGVWQDNLTDGSAPHRAGEAVFAYNYPHTYKHYLHSNTISFVASVSMLLLLISGLPFRRKTFMVILKAFMWLSITSMAFTYLYSIIVLTPKRDRESFRHTLLVAIPAWCGVIGLSFLRHKMHLAGRWLKRKGSVYLT